MKLAAANALFLGSSSTDNHEFPWTLDGPLTEHFFHSSFAIVNASTSFWSSSTLSVSWLRSPCAEVLRSSSSCLIWQLLWGISEILDPVISLRWLKDWCEDWCWGGWLDVNNLGSRRIDACELLPIVDSIHGCGVWELNNSELLIGRRLGLIYDNWPWSTEIGSLVMSRDWSLIIFSHKLSAFYVADPGCMLGNKPDERMSILVASGGVTTISGIPPYAAGSKPMSLRAFL